MGFDLTGLNPKNVKHKEPKREELFYEQSSEQQESESAEDLVVYRCCSERSLPSLRRLFGWESSYTPSLFNSELGGGVARLLLLTAVVGV